MMFRCKKNFFDPTRNSLLDSIFEISMAEKRFYYGRTGRFKRGQSCFEIIRRGSTSTVLVEPPQIISYDFGEYFIFFLCGFQKLDPGRI